MTAEPSLSSERAEVRIVTTSPETARRVADVLRRFFACDEGRSYPAGPEGTDTRLHLTLDASHAAAPSHSTHAVRPWIETSRRPTDRTHPREAV
ncbi:hypothetical protein [Streptomyces flavofungini]|uniref:Uncharacterized protein n=1 Tax=Streptomyces flavofungini TaxID=68200 RepID=A0ABS0XBG7_9ACTN|nr:hypothetical protein [Streptomyces flavofungini]MBJ3810289.1 hypothetical protein [Streptomyces flavofungini]GHC50709.1 hypothetical protein GCM10010349_15490 [Streptomyces flavofungini]